MGAGSGTPLGLCRAAAPNKQEKKFHPPLKKAALAEVTPRPGAAVYHSWSQQQLPRAVGSGVPVGTKHPAVTDTPHHTPPDSSDCSSLCDSMDCSPLKKKSSSNKSLKSINIPPGCYPIISHLKHILIFIPPPFIRHTHDFQKTLSFNFVPQLVEFPLPELLYPSALLLTFQRLTTSISSNLKNLSIFILSYFLNQCTEYSKAQPAFE